MAKCRPRIGSTIFQVSQSARSMNKERKRERERKKIRQGDRIACEEQKKNKVFCCATRPTQRTSQSGSRGSISIAGWQTAKRWNWLELLSTPALRAACLKRTKRVRNSQLQVASGTSVGEDCERCPLLLLLLLPKCRRALRCPKGCSYVFCHWCNPRLRLQRRQCQPCASPCSAERNPLRAQQGCDACDRYGRFHSGAEADFERHTRGCGEEQGRGGEAQFELVRFPPPPPPPQRFFLNHCYCCSPACKSNKTDHDKTNHQLCFSLSLSSTFNIYVCVCVCGGWGEQIDCTRRSSFPLTPRKACP